MTLVSPIHPSWQISGSPGPAYLLAPDSLLRTRPGTSDLGPKPSSLHRVHPLRRMGFLGRGVRYPCLGSVTLVLPAGEYGGASLSHRPVPHPSGIRFSPTCLPSIILSAPPCLAGLRHNLPPGLTHPCKTMGPRWLVQS